MVGFNKCKNNRNNKKQICIGKNESLPTKSKNYKKKRNIAIENILNLIKKTLTETNCWEKQKN